jgi:hypothetical protein
LKVKQQVDSSLLIQVVAGSVMEGASVTFHGDYKKRYLLTIFSQQNYVFLPENLCASGQAQFSAKFRAPFFPGHTQPDLESTHIIITYTGNTD